MRRASRPGEHHRLGPAWSLPGRSPNGRRGGHWLATAVAAFVVAVLLILAVLAEQARADVLVNAPASRVACGRPIVLGIWYQSFSGGPRWAHLTVRTASGHVVFHRNATAATSWRYWRYAGGCGRRYVVTYVTPGGTTRFRVRVG